MAVRITDIARSLNVSPTTVMRVIHNDRYVSPEKRKLIEDAIKELGYVPNKIAQGLKKQKTGMIGHILPQSHPNPFFAEISKGVDMEAYKNGYHVLTLYTYGDPLKEESMINDMAGRMVDGIIFTSAISVKNVEKALSFGIPVVMIERPFNIVGIDKVLADNFEGSYLATNYLLDKNHKKIGFIGVKPERDVEEQRYLGFVRAMEERGIPLENDFIKLLKRHYISSDGYDAIEEMTTDAKLPTAVFISSDMLSIGVLQFLYKKGIRVPEDISLISFDDTYAGILTPRLTAVALPMAEMGKTAVGMICENIDGAAQTRKTITLHPTIVERDSVKAL